MSSANIHLKLYPRDLKVSKSSLFQSFKPWRRMNVTFVDVFFELLYITLLPFFFFFLEAQLGNYEQIKADLEPVARL